MTDDGETRYDPETGEPLPPTAKPQPSATPLNGTWEDKLSPGGEPGKTPERQRPKPITVVICPITGQRATVSCPRTEARTFDGGSEPKVFCPVHR